ncbi:glycosyltransferase [Pendulispora brunnea]|uniref:Glycosyltransferase n=1 Tax=Pendulispora brunnea TaxID=2905690 RepID=A0ABZ2K5G7_9BACT
MNITIFGLSISSSWGNGHATLWRGLCRALSRMGHTVTFFERDVPYYAQNRDRPDPDGCTLHLYRDWAEVLPTVRRSLEGADAAIVTSYCADARAATERMLAASIPVCVFYDMDTPVTLDALEQGKAVSYLPAEQLSDFDLVLSFTGGRALSILKERLRARAVAALYGSVDPEVHRPCEPVDAYRADLSYLGTYARDRQPAVEQLFAATARAMPLHSFLLAGSLYPEELTWPGNVRTVSHVSPGDHPAFFGSSRLTLNVTREPMAKMGYCPSGRLFEAAACGVPLLSDAWEGLEQFFRPDAEILLARTTDDAVRAMCVPAEELARIARRARERVLDEHSATRRAEELVRLLESHSGPTQGR